MSTADPILNGIEAKTFSLVRKGFDPDEVRTYLLQVSVAVSGLRAEAAAPPPPPPPPPPAPVAPVLEVPDDETMAAARAELGRLRADQAAVKAWFGEDGRATPDQVPSLVRDAAATADALVRAAEEQAAAMAPVPMADPFAAPTAVVEPAPVLEDQPVEAPSEPVTAEAAGPPRGWEELGGSVARMLASAEDEANSIRTAAEATAAITRDEAESIRARADETLTEAEQQAAATVAQADQHASETVAQADRQAAETVAQADLQASETLAEADQHAADTVARAEQLAADTTAAAETRAAALRRAAEEGARAHIAEVLAQAEADLDRTRRELDAAHVQLTDIHTSVTQSLATRAPRPELDDLEATYAAALSVADATAAPEPEPVVAEPVVVAPEPAPTAPEPTHGLIVEGSVGDDTPFANAVVDMPPAPAAPVLPAPAEVPPAPEPVVPVPVPVPGAFTQPPAVPAQDPFASIAEAEPDAEDRPRDPFAGVEPFAAPQPVEATIGAPEAEGPVRGILADRAAEDDTTWSPRRTFGERLGLGSPDTAGEDLSSWRPPSPPPPPSR